MNVQWEIYIMNLVKKSIVRHCLSSVCDIVTETVELCKPGSNTDMDIIMDKIDIINDYVNYIYDIIELDDEESDETVISKDEIETIEDNSDKTMKEAYVDEINKTYDDFLHYQRLEDMRKGEGENPENWKVNKDEI